MGSISIPIQGTKIPHAVGCALPKRMMITPCILPLPPLAKIISSLQIPIGQVFFITVYMGMIWHFSYAPLEGQYHISLFKSILDDSGVLLASHSVDTLLLLFGLASMLVGT